MSDPVINVAYDFTISLVSQANNNVFQTDPTIAAGDFQISIADGALANLATLPVVAPAASDLVVIALSAAEMNGKKIVVIGKDAAGNEWADIKIELQPNVRGADDLAFPTVSDRSIDVTENGGVGIDWANVENQASTVNLSDTTTDIVNVATAVTAVIDVVNDVGITQDAADKVWDTTVRTITEGFKTNEAFANFPFEMFLVDGTSGTGLTVTAERSIDGGAYAAVEGAVSEVSDGSYTVDLTANDTNATKSVTYKFSATGAVDNKVSLVF